VVLGVNHVVATPFPDIGRLEHAGLLPARRICLWFYPRTRVADNLHAICTSSALLLDPHELPW
jgi:hypothetical protein